MKNVIRIVLAIAALTTAAQAQLKYSVSYDDDHPGFVMVTFRLVNDTPGYVPKTFQWDFNDCPPPHQTNPCPFVPGTATPAPHRYEPGGYDVMVITDDGKGNQRNYRAKLKLNKPVEVQP